MSDKFTELEDRALMLRDSVDFAVDMAKKFKLEKAGFDPNQQRDAGGRWSVASAAKATGKLALKLIGLGPEERARYSTGNWRDKQDVIETVAARGIAIATGTVMAAGLLRQGYWMVQPNMVLYHGTQSRAVGRILRQGLRTSAGGRGGGEARMGKWGTSDAPRQASLGHVYGTRNKGHAIQYAQQAAKHAPRSRPIVLKLRVPKSQVKRTVDPFSPGAGITERLGSDIRPEWIEAVAGASGRFRPVPAIMRKAEQEETEEVYLAITLYPTKLRLKRQDSEDNVSKFTELEDRVLVLRDSVDFAVDMAKEFDESKHPRDKEGKWRVIGEAAQSIGRVVSRGKALGSWLDKNKGELSKTGAKLAIQTMISLAAGMKTGNDPVTDQLVEHHVDNFSNNVGVARNVAARRLRQAWEMARRLRRSDVEKADSDDPVLAVMDQVIAALRRIENEEVEKFNPDQPRDEVGRWSAGGVARAVARRIFPQREPGESKTRYALKWVKWGTLAAAHVGLGAAIAYSQYQRRPYQSGPGKDILLGFHGTSSKAFARIAREGLKAGGPAGGADAAIEMWARNDLTRSKLDPAEISRIANHVKKFKKSAQGFTFVSRNEREAASYAHDVAKFRGGHPVVFKIELPASEFKKLTRRDYNSGMFSEAFKIERSIPPQYIKEVSAVKAPRRGGLIRERPQVSTFRTLTKQADGNVTFYVVLSPEDELVKTFDPNQPRDEEGKWSDTGAGARTPRQGKGRKASAAQVADTRAQIRELDQMLARHQQVLREARMREPPDAELQSQVATYLQQGPAPQQRSKLKIAAKIIGKAAVAAVALGLGIKYRKEIATGIRVVETLGPGNALRFAIAGAHLKRAIDFAAKAEGKKLDLIFRPATAMPRHRGVERLERMFGKAAGIDSAIDGLSEQEVARVLRTLPTLLTAAQARSLVRMEKVEWDESEHPRDEEGKWTEVVGGVARAVAGAAAGKVKEVVGRTAAHVSARTESRLRSALRSLHPREVARVVAAKLSAFRSELREARAAAGARWRGPGVKFESLLSRGGGPAFALASDKLDSLSDKEVTEAVAALPGVLDERQSSEIAAALERAGKQKKLKKTAINLALGKAFDPDQPRDEEGKWTDVGGGKRIPKDIPRFKNAVHARMWLREHLGGELADLAEVENAAAAMAGAKTKAERDRLRAALKTVNRVVKLATDAQKRHAQEALRTAGTNKQKLKHAAKVAGIVLLGVSPLLLSLASMRMASRQAGGLASGKVVGGGSAIHDAKYEQALEVQRRLKIRRAAAAVARREILRQRMKRSGLTVVKRDEAPEVDINALTVAAIDQLSEAEARRIVTALLAQATERKS